MFWIIALALVALMPVRADAFRVGIFADAPDSTCFTGPGEFESFAWAWTSGGMVYVTLRIDFPDNLESRAEPVFDPRVVEFTKTGYPDGSEEWHMVLEGCPPGWIRVFRQQVSLTDEQSSRVRIRSGDSWIRDCSFVLHRPDVMGDLHLNEPACDSVRASGRSWTVLKNTYE